MKKAVLIPDSFKGTMDAQTICAIWAQAIQNGAEAQAATCSPSCMPSSSFSTSSGVLP